VLRSAGRTGRIYYEAACPPGEADYPLAFPRVAVRPPSKGTTDRDVIRSLFRRDKDFSAAEDIGGVIRIRFGRVPDAILRTEISTLTLRPYEQFNPLLAIDAIVNSRDVRSAMDELHVVVPQRAINMAVLQPAEGLPHLPSEISNVTMDQAFDMIARTWSGVVLYGACRSPSMYEVSFADGGHSVTPLAQYDERRKDQTHWPPRLPTGGKLAAQRAYRASPDLPALCARVVTVECRPPGGWLHGGRFSALRRATPSGRSIRACSRWSSAAAAQAT
jgi:hypothetical protein